MKNIFKEKTISKEVVKEEVKKVKTEKPKEIPKVEYYNGVEILSKEDRENAFLLTLADGTTTFVEKE